jgi:hypothetical protein
MRNALAARVRLKDPVWNPACYSSTAESYGWCFSVRL